MKPLIGLTPEILPASRSKYSKPKMSLSVRYTDAIRSAGGIPIILPLTTDRNTLHELMRCCAAILLPGGEDISARFYHPHIKSQCKKLLQGVDETRDEMELFLARAALATGKPVLGICRGAQLLNVAAGGSLLFDIPTQVSNALEHQRQEGDAKHEIELKTRSRLRSIFTSPKLNVNSSHHQAVARVAKDFCVTACAADGVVEAIEKPSHPFAIGVQFHPERMLQHQPKTLRLFEAFVAAATASPSPRRSEGR